MVLPWRSRGSRFVGTTIQALEQIGLTGKERTKATKEMVEVAERPCTYSKLTMAEKPRKPMEA